ncbi:MAG TPA: hypothetical protein VFU12_00630 [Glycomyces sp.]|nr:hypothetical protein [Glycomyces sp.]
MAFMHRTTMTPTKLELLAEWLPKRPWYLGAAAPRLVKAGGFRLDDPEGEVGIEFMVVADTAAPEPVAYLAPMGYRGATLEGMPEESLIGVSEHGVLGPRWLYDGERDPVVAAQLRALMRGKAEPQHQSESHTPDPTVTVRGSSGEGEVRINRVLRPLAAGETPEGLIAGWTWPDGTPVQGVFATVAPR